MASRSLLSREEFRLIAETRDLLDSVLETLEIERDPVAMRKIRASREDVRRGRTRPLKEFLKELEE